jgi:hypothetical protein
MVVVVTGAGVRFGGGGDLTVLAGSCERGAGELATGELVLCGEGVVAEVVGAVTLAAALAGGAVALFALWLFAPAEVLAELWWTAYRCFPARASGRPAAVVEAVGGGEAAGALEPCVAE